MPTPDERLAGLLRAEREGALPPVVAFWGHEPLAGGAGPWVLSQWYEAPFEVDGVRVPTSEHWMMAEKARVFGDDEAYAQVLGAPTPEQAKRLGRGVRGFDSARWAAVAYGVVVRGNLAKFGAHPDLGAYLLGTAGAVLVEASPEDRVWGTGRGDAPADLAPSRWTGRNLLGFALMDVRDALG